MDYEGYFGLIMQKYKGEFYEDNKWGMGKCTWANGRKYEGEYKNDKKKEVGAAVAK